MGKISATRTIRRAASPGRSEQCFNLARAKCDKEHRTFTLYSGQIAAQRRQLGSTSSSRDEEKELAVEDSWRKLFKNPLKWWDDLFSKGSSHGKGRDFWCSDGALNPHWIEEQLVLLKESEGSSYQAQRAPYLQHSIANCVGTRRYRARAENTGSSGNLGVLRKLREEGWVEEAVEVINKMDQQGMEISSNVILCLLQEAINKKDLSIGRELHRLTLKNKLESDTFLGTFFIRLFSLCGLLGDAVEAFSKVTNPSVFTWSAMISAHAKLGKGEDGVKLYHQMLKESPLKPEENVLVAVLKACASIPSLDEGKGVHKFVMDNGLGTNINIGCALIDMYTKCGSLEEARMVFEKLPKRDLSAWNVMIDSYAHFKRFQEALRLFQLLQQERLRPNDVTFVNILKACSNVGALDQGELIHAQISKTNYESNIFVANALINMYITLGSLEKACDVFAKLRYRDAVTWTAMISGYIQHGHARKALELIPQMQQEARDLSEAFVLLLKACSGVSAVDEGRLLHARLMGSTELDVNIGSALIDMYSKFGNLEDARRVFEKCKQNFSEKGIDPPEAFMHLSNGINNT